MGWTSYHATHYKKGIVDRKAECDAYFMESLNRGYFEVLKSTVVGSVYYAAVKCLKKEIVNENGEKEIVDKPIEEQKIWAAVFLTSVDSKDYYNFSYKDMDESVGLCCYDCPESILNLLDDTDSKWALEWRNKCREHAKSRKKLGKLPVGTKISFMRGDETIECVKHSAAYQFKTPFWIRCDSDYYVKSKNIPDNYVIIFE